MSGTEKDREGLDGFLAVWDRRKWLALSVFAAVITLAASVAAFVPNVYRATVTFLVERQDTAESLVRPGAESELDMRLQTVGQKILSRSRLADLIQRLDLYRESRAMGAPMEAVIGQMRRDILLVPKSADQVGDGGGTITLALSYWGKNPQTVARVANALASSYVDDNLQSRQRQAAGAVTFLKAQLEEAKARLERSSDKQARLVERQKALSKPVAQLDSSGGPDLAAARLAKLKQDLAELRTQFKDRYPDVVRLREQINVLERQLPDSSLASPAPPPDGSALGRLKESLTEVDAGLLASDYETEREHYLSLVKRYEEARLGERMALDQQGDQFQILDQAVVPDQPASASRVVILFGGLVAALGSALGTLFLAERLDTSFHSRRDLREFTRVPILASISRIATRADGRERRRKVFLRALSATAALLILVGVSYFLAHWAEPWLLMLAGKRA